MINLIVKQLIFNTCTLEDDDNVESDSEEHAISDHEYNESKKVMRAAVQKIKRVSSVHDRFLTVLTAIRGLSDPPPDSNCKQPKDFLEVVVDSFLQNRLSTPSHSRNVFLNCNKLFSRK